MAADHAAVPYRNKKLVCFRRSISSKQATENHSEALRTDQTLIIHQVSLPLSDQTLQLLERLLRNVLGVEERGE